MAIVETLFAVLDGPAPRAWSIWDTTFGALEEGVRTQESGRPLDLPVVDTVKMRPLLESTGDLLARENWRTVVGCFIDVSARRHAREVEIRDAHIE
jgi:hypothetical protein